MEAKSLKDDSEKDVPLTLSLLNIRMEDVVELLETYHSDGARLAGMKTIMSNRNIGVNSRDMARLILPFTSDPVRLEALRYLVDYTRTINPHYVIGVVDAFRSPSDSHAALVALVPKVTGFDLPLAFSVMDLFPREYRALALKAMYEKILPITESEFNSHLGGLDNECRQILLPKIEKTCHLRNLLKGLDGVSDSSKIEFIVSFQPGFGTIRENPDVLLEYFEDKASVASCCERLGIAYNVYKNPIIDVMGQELKKSSIRKYVPFVFGTTKCNTIMLADGNFHVTIYTKTKRCVVTCPLDSAIVITKDEQILCNDVAVNPM